MADYKKRTELTTPRGSFRYPRLNEPDTKFKAEGEYSVSVIMPAADAAPLVAVIQAAEEEVLAEAMGGAKNAKEAKAWAINNHPYADEEDDDGEPTGNVILKASMKASGVSTKTGKPWSRKPAVFDATGGRIKNPPKIGGGTVGKINVQLIPYSPNAKIGAGVKLALEGVQIIDLREFGERSAEQMGFGNEEGGWSGDSNEPDVDDATDDSAADGETDF